MTTRCAIFISIRNKATRLPGKSFVELGGLPAVDQLLTRMKRVAAADGIVICTSTHPDDAVFEDVAERNAVSCFRGSEEDKLDRYLAAAGEVGAEFVVVVDGDDVLCDPAQVGRVITAWKASAASDAPLDYVVVDHLPVGATGFGVRVPALRRGAELKAASDPGASGGYFTGAGLFHVAPLGPGDGRRRRPTVLVTPRSPAAHGSILAGSLLASTASNSSIPSRWG